MRWLAALALLVWVAGCQQHDTPGAPGDAINGEGTPSRTSPARAPKPINKAVLDAEGVTFDSPAGKTLEFAYGAPRQEVDALAVRMFGPPDDRSVNGECGAGPIEFSRYGPLTLNFQDGKLVGWLAHAGPQVTTSDGIRPGGFMRDLKVARSVRLNAGSTLEGEFHYLAADGRAIGGFVKGAGRDARIESLYAGVNCFFR